MCWSMGFFKPLDKVSPQNFPKSWSSSVKASGPGPRYYSGLANTDARYCCRIKQPGVDGETRKANDTVVQQLEHQLKFFALVAKDH